MATFHEGFLKCVEVSTVYRTDFDNPKKSLLRVDKQYYERTNEYYNYYKKSNNEIPGDICEYYKRHNEF